MSTSPQTFSTAYSWGWNNLQLALPNENTEIAVESPTELKNSIFSKVKVISCGGSHNILVTTDGELYTWGRNQCGQLGNGSTTDESQPIQINTNFLNPGESIVSVSCGDRHTVIVTDKGDTYSFGANFNGQLGLGHNANVTTPTEIVMLKAKKIRRVYCGSRHSVFLSATGALYTCGYGFYGQLGHGDNLDQWYPKKINIEEKFRSVSCRENNTVALSESYEVYQWGGQQLKPEEEETGITINNVPTKIMSMLNGRRILKLAASSTHCLAMTKDGVYAWGRSLDNLGYTKYLEEIEASYYKDNASLSKKEKEVADKNLDMSNKYIIREKNTTVYKNHSFNGEKIIHIACGDTSNYVVTEKGNLYSWGKGLKSELGQGKKVTECDFPTKIKELEGKFVAHIECGNWYCIAFVGDINSAQQFSQSRELTLLREPNVSE